MTTRTDALTVPCPYCDAPEGEPCAGARGKLRTSIHAERHVAFMKSSSAQRHPATLEPWDHPPAYDAPEPPTPGRIQHPIPPDAIERGQRWLQVIRPQPEQPEPEPPW